jgi:hypothetical protein
MVRKVKSEVLVLDTTIPVHAGFDVLAEIRQMDAGPFENDHPGAAAHRRQLRAAPGGS